MEKTAKIGVLGAGVEGLETMRYLVAHGFEDVTLFDRNENLVVDLSVDFFRPMAKLKSNPELGFPLVQKVFGADYLERAEGCDVVFRSPGVDLKKLGGLRKKVKQLTSATRYFFEKCPCPIIGVTGTKGKGTTSTLIYLMLKEAGRDVYLGGNIGESPLKFLDKLTADSLVVLELSSFQLQDLDRSPQVAVLLGVTSDHLDYHENRGEYWEAKAALVKHQKPEDLAILNYDYESSEYYAKLTAAKKIWVSTYEPGVAPAGSNVSRQGGTSLPSTLGSASRVGDGVHLSGPMIVNCTGAKAGIAGDSGATTIGGRAGSVPSGGICELICSSKKIALIGRHHLENILPAVAVARHFGVTVPNIQKVLTTFKGLPHRLEEVAVVGDVRYFDDSISTTPEPSIAAVRAFDAPVILIAGGSDKRADYTDWGIALQQAVNLKCVVLAGPGPVTDRMEKSLRSAEKTLDSRGLGRHYPLEVVRCLTFEDAVRKAHEKAAPGDVVVLSPAAASFDMFKNYRERGDTFKNLALGFNE